MANQNIQDIIQAPKGETTSDDVVRENVIREIVFKQSDLIAVGTNIVPERTFGALDVDFSYPGEIDGEYPVAENSIVDRERVQWKEFDLQLHQAEARFMLTDIARIRGQNTLQNEMSLQRASEAIAKEKDENILSTLRDGAPDDNNIVLDRDSDEGWDQDNADIENDVMRAWNNIFQNSNVNEDDVENSHLVLPAGVHSNVQSLQLINNVQQTLRDYLETSIGLNIHFSRILDDYNDAIFAVGGEDTAIHGVLDADEIDMVETSRELGRGDDTLVRQFFNTAIVEDWGLTNESYRIARIEDVSE